MKYVTTEARKWVVLGALVLTSLTVSSAYGEDHTRCEQAYLESGLTQQQLSFEEFRQMYSHTICASADLAAKHQQFALSEEVVAM